MFEDIRCIKKILVNSSKSYTQALPQKRFLAINFMKEKYISVKVNEIINNPVKTISF